MLRFSCNEAKFRLEAIQEELAAFNAGLDEYAVKGDSNSEYRIMNVRGNLERMVKELKMGLEGKADLNEAKEILGQDFLGPEAVEKTWGVKLEAKNIPPIPFTTEDLERAKELGQFLILRMPFTMQVMERLAKEPVFREDLFKHEDIYTKETCKEGWALVTKEPILNSTNKNYIEQTQRICEYLESVIFGNVDEMPETYQNAIIEFEAKKQDLETLMHSDWRECAKQLAELQITKLTRQSAADVIHDLLVYKQNNDERLLKNVYTWTSARFSGGSLVCVGDFESDGVDVGSNLPGDAYDDLGVSFSRSL